ncbi:MAG: hypothetical protein CMN57_11460 [Gammaproteobacteria bacterium]|nr:hypothetical protein [Gammaproteobacteria bacterium]
MMKRAPDTSYRSLHSAALLLALTLATVTSHAHEAFPARVLEAADLAALRGGFSLRGLEMEFGASLRSFQDGRLLMETLVSVTDRGTHTTTSIPRAVDTLSPGPETAARTGSSPPAANSGIELNGLGSAGRVVVNDARGMTASIHEVTRQRILGVLVSRATDTALRQEAQVDVTIRNFSQFQQTVRQAILNNHLGRSSAPLQ